MRYCLFFLFYFFFTKSLYTQNYETLIDFSTYSKHLNKSNNLFVNSNKEKIFRKKIYSMLFKRKLNNNFKIEKLIKYHQFWIPYFRVLTSEMKLDRWLISYKYFKTNPKAKSQFSEFKVINFIESKPVSLFLPLYFPSILGEISALVKPIFDIYPYDLNGNFSNISHGVLNNVSEIENIELILGLKANYLDNLQFELNLENEQGAVISYVLGHSYRAGRFKEKYYKMYDGISFKNKDEIIINNADHLSNILSDYSSYFKVNYRNGKISNWEFHKKGNQVYREYFLRWTNSNYLAPTFNNTKIKIYPRNIPYIRFHSFIIRRLDAKKGGIINLFLRKISLKYLKAIPEIDLNINDESIWHILKSKQKVKRRILEAHHANKIYKMLEKAKIMGFVSYENFYNNYLNPFFWGY